MEGKNHKTHARSKSRVGRQAGREESHGVHLSTDERDLVILRDELYGGSWNDMLADLKNRMTGKPYVFKLVNRIEHDIENIERLRALEEEKGINLADMV
jgi:hypothetical protein